MNSFLLGFSHLPSTANSLEFSIFISDSKLITDSFFKNSDLFSENSNNSASHPLQAGLTISPKRVIPAITKSLILGLELKLFSSSSITAISTETSFLLLSLSKISINFPQYLVHKSAYITIYNLPLSISNLIGLSLVSGTKPHGTSSFSCPIASSKYLLYFHKIGLL